MNMRNSIRTWALVAVTISSLFTVGAALWIIGILSADNWCTNILGASKYIEGRPDFAVIACKDLLLQNSDHLGLALAIAMGVQAISLLVLVVIVLAGGRLSFKASREGVEANMSREAKAAHKVADAAEEEAESITSTTVDDPD